MKNWSLRLKITLLVGFITTTACFALTTNAIISADSYYGTYISEGIMLEDHPQSIEGLPGAKEHALEIPVNSDFRAITRRFSARSLNVMVLIVSISLILAYWITGRILHPLGKLTKTIRDMDQKNLHERVELSDATGEVRQLAQSFNGLLERLEESFELQKHYSSNAAHELKTPLTVMKTSLQVLEMEDCPAPDDYQDFIEDTRESVERLIRTVDNLLALTRDTEGETPAEVSFDDLFQQVAEELGTQAADRLVSLHVEFSGQTLVCNRTLVYRLLYNLTENAIKYNRPKGDVFIRLIKEGKRMGTEVEDTGIGMDSETLRHIYEPFYRADESRSQEIPGSGLGLSITKMIAERLNGNLEISSHPCVGTRVRFLFPENHEKI